jgi:hypothetical protein
MTTPFDANNRPAAQDRRMLAKALSKLFDQWQLSEADQLVLLGLRAEESGVLSMMRERGELADSTQLAERARALLKIYRYLSMLYPEHPQLRNKWLRASHPRLDGQSPFERIGQQGAAGVRFVTILLEEQLF